MKKIFLGPTDSGDNYYYKLYLERIGYKVTTCVFKDRSKLGLKNDIDLKLKKTDWHLIAWRLTINFFKSLGFNLYHFTGGMSLLPLNLDLPILRLLGKKIIMHYKGSTLRQLDRFKNDRFNKIYVEKVGYSWAGEVLKRVKYKWVKFWVHKIYVSTPDLLAFAKEGKYIQNFNSLDCSLENKGNSTFTVLHLPTNEAIKGTDYIKKAINKLRKEGANIKLNIVTNKKHSDICSSYKEADIVIDQLLIGSYGKVAIEAMGCGKPVLCYIRDDLKKYYPKSLPIINANPQTCYEILKSLLKNENRLKKLSIKSKEYSKKYHHPLKIINLWNREYKKLLK